MIADILAKVREKKPLVHHITNIVTVNDCANATLAVGALPVMAHAPEEVEEMVQAAQALVLNIGTLTEEQVRAMVKAGKAANAAGVPVVFDPVGAGATAMRTRSARLLMSEVKVAVVKGNSAEVATLAGEQGKIRGVEAVGESGNLLPAARRLARESGSVVVASGIVDLVTDGERVAFVENGHPLMGTITGTGCMLTSVVATFVGAGGDAFEAAVAALVAFGVAGELAAARPEVRGPGSFKVSFFDELHALTPEKLAARSRWRLA